MPSFEQPAPTRSAILEEPGALRIRIPLRRTFLVILFLPVWLAGWSYGGWETGHRLFRQFDWFSFFWMGGWVLGECWAIYWFLRTVTGWDLLNAFAECLAVKKTTLGLGVTKNYRPTDIRNLRFQPQLQKARGSRPAGIAFDYGAKTVVFGDGIDEVEGNQLISLIKSRCGMTETAPLTPAVSGITFWQQG